jgi:ribosome maturation factor RimP
VKSLSEQVEELLTPTIQGMGFEVVQIKILDSKNSRLLQIMAERPDGSMSLDDCEAISKQVSAVMDVEDLIPTAYRLEVGSPGIDRPLRHEADYAAYAGHLAKVELALPVAGRKRFTGIIQTSTGGVLTLEVDGKTQEVPVSDVQSAKLVLTDALIKAHQKKKVS